MHRPCTYQASAGQPLCNHSLHLRHAEPKCMCVRVQARVCFKGVLRAAVKGTATRCVSMCCARRASARQHAAAAAFILSCALQQKDGKKLLHALLASEQ